MSTLAVVLIVIAVVLLLLFVGGYIANARRREAERAALHERTRAANEHLAEAHAADKGWERTTMESAARAAYAQRKGVEPRTIDLVQVVDRPGTDEDKAIFMADGDELVLGRRDGQWVAE
jgi:type II secretory pathway pseudopilin PulG